MFARWYIVIATFKNILLYLILGVYTKTIHLYYSNLNSELPRTK